MGDSVIHATVQLKSLQEALERFKACVRWLPEALFGTRMDGWARRGVVAHLIGWNRYTIEGCREILDGQKPHYLSDAANDSSNLNAESVRRYSSEDRQRLLAELDCSFDKLRVYLGFVDAARWEAHRGVGHERWVIPAADSIDALRRDYEAHREEIKRRVLRAGNRSSPGGCNARGGAAAAACRYTHVQASGGRRVGGGLPPGLAMAGRALEPAPTPCKPSSAAGSQ